MRCEYDKIVLANFASGEMNDEDRLEIEKHLEECSSCRNRLAGIRRGERKMNRIKPETNPEFLKQSCGDYPEHLDLLMKKTVVESDEAYITAGSIGAAAEGSRGKVAVDDCQFSGKVIKIAGGDICSDATDRKQPKSTAKLMTNLVPTPPPSTNGKFKLAILSECDSLLLKGYAEDILKKIQELISNKYEVVSHGQKEAKIGKEANALLRIHLTATNVFRLEVAIAEVKNGKVLPDYHSARMTAKRCEMFMKMLEKMLEWMLAEETLF